jgi:hypothetical protein
MSESECVVPNDLAPVADLPVDSPECKAAEAEDVALLAMLGYKACVPDENRRDILKLLDELKTRWGRSSVRCLASRRLQRPDGGKLAVKCLNFLYEVRASLYAVDTTPQPVLTLTALSWEQLFHVVPPVRVPSVYMLIVLMCDIATFDQIDQPSWIYQPTEHLDSFGYLLETKSSLTINDWRLMCAYLPCLGRLLFSSHYAEPSPDAAGDDVLLCDMLYGILYIIEVLLRSSGHIPAWEKMQVHNLSKKPFELSSFRGIACVDEVCCSYAESSSRLPVHVCVVDEVDQIPFPLPCDCFIITQVEFDGWEVTSELLHLYNSNHQSANKRTKSE